MADVVESGRLARICAELDISPRMAYKFVTDYLALLDLRLARIEGALEGLSSPGLDHDVSIGLNGTVGTTGPNGQVGSNSTDNGWPRTGARTRTSEDCIVALLSLDASSSMLGAYEVALVARRLRIEVQLGRSPSVGRYRQDLRRAVERTRRQLDEIKSPHEPQST